MATATATGRPAAGRAWIIVLQQELRDLWVGGRGLLLSLGFSILLSVVAYLVATNRTLNFLEQCETVNLTLQVAIAVGALLALLAGADAVSGERERRTLESLLLTPVSRFELTLGKLLAALSLWFAAFVITLPYVWFLGRGVGVAGDAVATGAAVGTLLAIALASLGLLISLFAASTASASRRACSCCSPCSRRRSCPRERRADGWGICCCGSIRSAPASITWARSWSTVGAGRRTSPGSFRRLSRRSA